MKVKEARMDDAKCIAKIIREANLPTAVQFGINQENCPKHPSFCEQSWVEADFERGERYFLFIEDAFPIACVAYEEKSISSDKVHLVNTSKAYLNRLSVLPERQNKGVGSALVQHIVTLAKANQIVFISLGIIAKHDALLSWYENMGFIKGDTKHFDHLPFAVMYMKYTLTEKS